MSRKRTLPSDSLIRKRKILDHELDFLGGGTAARVIAVRRRLPWEASLVDGALEPTVMKAIVALREVHGESPRIDGAFQPRVLANEEAGRSLDDLILTLDEAVDIRQGVVHRRQDPAIHDREILDLCVDIEAQYERLRANHEGYLTSDDVLQETRDPASHLDDHLDFIGAVAELRLTAQARRMAGAVLLADGVLYTALHKTEVLIGVVYGQDARLDGARLHNAPAELRKHSQSIDDSVHALSGLIDARQGATGRGLDPERYDHDVLALAIQIRGWMAETYAWGDDGRGLANQ